MRPQLIGHPVHLMGPILATTGIIRQANRRPTSVMATGSALKRGRMGKLLGTRPDHVCDGVANSNPEPSQMEEGYHPSSLMGVVRKDSTQRPRRHEPAPAPQPGP